MRKQILICLGTVFFIIVLDQVSKSLALSHLNVHRNYGIFLGFLSNSTTLFRVVTLSTLSAFLIFIYSVLIYLLPRQVFFLKVTLSVVLGGILGNVVDRITRSFTIDFIPVKLGTFVASYNVADIFLWCGTFYFIFSIFRHEDKIWHPDNARNRYLINPKEQLRLAFKFLLISFFTSVFLGVFCFSFLQSLHQLKGGLMYEFLVIYIVLAFLFSISTFLIGVIISHRSAGPLYAFEQYVEKLLTGKDEKLVLRDGDNYKHLEQVADKLRSHFSNKK